MVCWGPGLPRGDKRGFEERLFWGVFVGPSGPGSSDLMRGFL